MPHAPARATKPEPRARSTEKGAGGELPSSGEAEINRLKGELIVSLFTKRGPFWESIKKVRERWGVTPHVRVPPAAAATDAFDPEFGFHLPEKPLLPARVLGAHQVGIGFLSAWKRAINGLQERTLPEKYHSREALREWGSFFAACVLYDPPKPRCASSPRSAVWSRRPATTYGSQERQPPPSFPACWRRRSRRCTSLRDPITGCGTASCSGSSDEDREAEKQNRDLGQEPEAGKETE